MRSPASVPSSTERIRLYLAPRERLLWTGRPRANRLGRALWPGIVWGLGVALVIWAVGQRNPDYGSFGRIAGILLVLLGLFCLGGWIPFAARKRRRTAYGLTDQRLFIVLGDPSHPTVRSLPLQSVLRVELTETRDGSGEVSFHTTATWYPGGESDRVAFDDLEDARRVYDLVHRARSALLAATISQPSTYHWDLPAPEAAVLLWGYLTKEAPALKLALLELVARGALRLVTVDDPGRGAGLKRTNVLVPGRWTWPTVRSLQVVREAYHSARPRVPAGGTVGVPVTELASAVMPRQGDYVDRDVLPALEERGLYRRERVRPRSRHSPTRWVPTPAGEAKRADLAARLARWGDDVWGLLNELSALAEDPNAFMSTAVAAIDTGVTAAERFKDAAREPNP